jgi:hypothetical protein
VPTSANESITAAATGPATAAALAPPARFSIPRRNQACGRGEAECCEQAAGLRDGEERAAEHPEHEGDHRLPRLGPVRRARQRGDERHHRGRGDHAGADQQRNAERIAPVGVEQEVRRAASTTMLTAPSATLVSSLPPRTAVRRIGATSMRPPWVRVEIVVVLPAPVRAE